jgi:hypothetical protein
MSIGYGSVSASDINTELGRSATAAMGIDEAENGSYGCINAFASPKPSSGNPAYFSEWQGYNHGYYPGITIDYYYTYYYTYCADSFGYTAVVQADVSNKTVPNDYCYGSYYSFYITATNVIYYYYSAECDSCLTHGTKITMADGSLKNVEDIQIGDVLLTADIQDLPNEDALYKQLDIVNLWSNPDITGFNYNTATVVGLYPGTTTRFFSMNNGLLESTGDHIHLIKDCITNEWVLSRTFEMKVGDQFIDVNKNIVTIESISVIHKETPVVGLDVENLDLFFANGVLTHNRPPKV